VDEGQGVFAFGEVVAEAFLGGVLVDGGEIDGLGRRGKGGSMGFTYFSGCEVLIVVADLEVGSD